MWDSFTSGIALSDMRNAHKHNGENEFAEMELSIHNCNYF